MDVNPFIDQKTVTQLSRGIAADHAIDGNVIFQAPRINYPGISKKGRRVYKEAQLDEALAQYKKNGIKAAEEITGVPRDSIYKWAARQEARRKASSHGQQAAKAARLRYPPEKLREAFDKAVQFHLNSAPQPRHRVAITVCIRRAAKICRINENYLLALYTNRNPLLGFSPQRPHEVLPGR